MSKNIFIIFIFIKLNSKLNGWVIKQYKIEANTNGGYIGINHYKIALDGYKPVCIASYTLSSSSWYAITSMWLDFSVPEITIAGRHILNSQTVEHLTFYINVLYVPE